MKHKLISISLLWFALMILTSCNLYYRIRLGIKDPKVENYQSVGKSFAMHFKSAPNNVFIAKDSACFVNLYKRTKSVPQTQLYEKNGFLVKMQDSGYCYAKAESFITTLNPGIPLKLDTSYRLPDILRFIKPIHQNLNVDLRGYDFVFIGYWAVFLGRGNKNVYDVYLEMIKKSDLKIYYIFVNFDVLEEWGNISLKTRK